MRTIRLLAAVATVAALAAGCGGGGGEGGDRLSKEEYIAAADKVCADANSQLAALGEPTLDTFDEYVKQAEKIARSQLERLRALKPPTEDEATITKAYDLTERQIELAVEAAAAFKGGDQAKFNDITAEIDTVNAQADQIARDYGLKECGKNE